MDSDEFKDMAGGPDGMADGGAAAGGDSVEDEVFKATFLEWLNRFAYIGPIRELVEQHKFSVNELEFMKAQIAAKYRLKKEFMERQGS